MKSFKKFLFEDFGLAGRLAEIAKIEEEIDNLEENPDANYENDPDVWGGGVEFTVLDFEDEEDLHEDQLDEDRPNAKYELKKDNSAKGGFTIVYRDTKKPLEDDTIDEILKKLNKNKSKTPKIYDYVDGGFTLNGKALDKEELIKDVLDRLNGAAIPSFGGHARKDLVTKKGIRLAKKIENDDWWNHYSVMTSGSKVGHCGNFSLPPGKTCAPNVPCLNDGCYAVKAWRQYPTTRVAWQKNMDLLSNGKYTQLVNEVSTIIKRRKLKFFRFNVSGDVFSPEYLDAMAAIARKNGDVKFWFYTKQFDLLHDKLLGKPLPKNLTCILSSWNDNLPPEDLAAIYPVAYLDDTNYLEKSLKKLEGKTRKEDKDVEDMEKFRKDLELHRSYLPTESFKICPCTEYGETAAESHCDTCQACCSSNGEKIDIVFKKH